MLSQCHYIPFSIQHLGDELYIDSTHISTFWSSNYKLLKQKIKIETLYLMNIKSML